MQQWWAVTHACCCNTCYPGLRGLQLFCFSTCRACYGVLRFIMESGAKGCEVIVSGKLRAQRAKAMKFKDGYMISSGQPVHDFIDSAVRHVLLRQGVLGIKVRSQIDVLPFWTYPTCEGSLDVCKGLLLGDSVHSISYGRTACFEGLLMSHMHSLNTSVEETAGLHRARCCRPWVGQGIRLGFAKVAKAILKHALLRLCR